MNKKLAEYLRDKINSMTIMKLNLDKLVKERSGCEDDNEEIVCYRQKIERIEACVLVINYLLINKCGNYNEVKDLVSKIEASPSISDQRNYLASRSYKLPSIFSVVGAEIEKLSRDKSSFFSLSKKQLWKSHLAVLQDKLVEYCQELNEKDSLEIRY